MSTVVRILTFSFLFCSLLLPLQLLNAQDTSNAISISPFKIEQVVERGKMVTFTIEFSNNSTEKKNVKPSALDFTASKNGDGIPQFLAPTNESYTRGLRTWIQPIDSFSLESKEKKEVTFTAKVPTNASVGGHYGAIFFSTTGDNSSESSVGVESSVGSLLFITVAGEVTRNMQLLDLEVQPFNAFTQGSVQFNTTMQNFGTIHEKPRGEIVLMNMLGNKVGESTVNDELGVLLPDDTRRFTSNWGWIGGALFPPVGLINAKLTVNVTDMNDEQPLVAETSFWLFPIQYVALTCIFFGTLFWNLSLYFKRKHKENPHKIPTEIKK
jgi:hypothetical protein